MLCDEDSVSPPYPTRYDGLYNASIGSSASSSTASVFSDNASQASDDSQSSIAESDSADSYCYSSQPSCEAAPAACWPSNVPAESDYRPNPRRTGASRAGPPPLVRQCERKVLFVDSLVDSSAQIVEAIWPLSSVACRNEMGAKGVLPLRTFIEETLRRSRTSYSTLQVALYYLILIKPHVPKHDFTMEQPDDSHSSRALQCGRRMFLSALILASKYLQDRNYSARAWSKISGLKTEEINQNEIAFLLAVNWEIHITDAVFQRWTDIVLKYTPTQPPSPGGMPRSVVEATASWKSIVLILNPQLDNVGLTLAVVEKAEVRSISAISKPVVERSYSYEGGSNESTPTPRYYAPRVLEPSLATSYPSVKPAPALGLLPTPRLTPQNTGFNTPAASAYMSGRSSMCFAMAQAATSCAEKWLTPPAAYLGRRSSLANSVSSMSSPESMVSDTSSRSSRSSSISSASSLSGAPHSSTKLDVLARCRYAKQCSAKQARMITTTVPEFTSSPESYSSGPAGNDFLELESGEYYDASVNDAARALQELHSHPRHETSPTGTKRRRPTSVDASVQESVRGLLQGENRSWSESLVRGKRVCAAPRPAMWAILN